MRVHCLLELFMPWLWLFAPLFCVWIFVGLTSLFLRRTHLLNLALIVLFACINRQCFYYSYHFDIVQTKNSLSILNFSGVYRNIIFITRTKTTTKNFHKRNKNFFTNTKLNSSFRWISFVNLCWISVFPKVCAEWLSVPVQNIFYGAPLSFRSANVQKRGSTCVYIDIFVCWILLCKSLDISWHVEIYCSCSCLIPYSC